MTIKTVVMLLFGLACIALGYLMSTNVRVAEWGLSGRRASIWISLLGKERALKTTRFVFGPLTVLLGVVVLLGTFLTRGR